MPEVTNPLCFTSPAEWRAWLQAHGAAEPAAWLAIRRAGEEVGVTVPEAVEQALCFGWIDGVAARDDRHFYVRFSRRNPKSTWSKVNRERVDRLTRSGQMTEHGQAVIDLARRTGTWDRLAAAQDLVVPDDLASRLAADPEADRHFRAFPPSSRRLILEWIATAKRPATRARRVEETATLAATNRRAHH